MLNSIMNYTDFTAKSWTIYRTQGGCPINWLLLLKNQAFLAALPLQITATQTDWNWSLTWGLKKPVIQNDVGRPSNNQVENCWFRSSRSVNQKPSVADSQEIFFQLVGTRASNMLSRASRRFSLMMMVPSIASLRSDRVVRTRVMTFCILSISWRRKMLIGWSMPIFLSLSLTCQGKTWWMNIC